MGCLRAPLENLGVRWQSHRFGTGRAAHEDRDARKDRKAAAIATALLNSNRKWGNFADKEIEKWTSGGRAIFAGQQVGFAGGPLYTLAKVATVVKMKRALEASGQPATAFFWLATEDHDYDEAARLYVPVSTIPSDRHVNRQIDLVELRAVRTNGRHAMVGPQQVPETLISQLLALYDMPRPQWLREGITFGDSFAELIASVFGSEVVLVDALLPELRRAGAPLFAQLRARHDEIQGAVGPGQVIARDGEHYTLLFEIDDDGNRKISMRDVPPERTSTSALTRPLLQDFVFGTDVFVGGPSEVAYFEQIAPLYDLLDIRMPRIALRGHALVAPKRIVRAFDRYGIEPGEIFRDPDEILAEREPDGVTRIREIANNARRDLLGRIEQIGELALPADHALARAFNRSVGHLEYHFEKLTERAIRGLVRKDTERLAIVRELVATLYPDRKVQDRVVGWFPWWHRYGQHLVDSVIDCVEADAETFGIVSL